MLHLNWLFNVYYALRINCYERCCSSGFRCHVVIGIYWQVYTVPKPRRSSSSSPLWKRHISQVFWVFILSADLNFNVGIWMNLASFKWNLWQIILKIWKGSRLYFLDVPVTHYQHVFWHYDFTRISLLLWFWNHVNPKVPHDCSSMCKTPLTWPYSKELFIGWELEQGSWPVINCMDHMKDELENTNCIFIIQNISLSCIQPCNLKVKYLVNL
jgi:hypothetical protein